MATGGGEPTAGVALPATWSPTITNLTVGNGSFLAASYTQGSKLVVARFIFKFGSTSSVGGVLSVSLPVNAVFDAGFEELIGTAMAKQASSGRIFPLGLLLSATGTCELDYITDVSVANTSSYAATNSTVPLTWTTNDILAGYMTYQAA